MTNLSTTTKEALEPCPRWTVTYNIVSPESDAWVGTGWEFFNDEKAAEACYKRHRNLGNIPTKRAFYDSVDRQHLGAVDRARVFAPSVAPEVDDKLIERVVEAVNRSKSINADGEWWLDMLKAKARVKKLLRAPASPAAPTSSDSWGEWFNRLGAKASAEVVNATADLVTNERLAALVQAKVLPGPAALRDEAHGFAGISKSVPCKKCGLIYSALVHHAATTPPSTPAKAAAAEIADYISDGVLGMGNEVTEADTAKILAIIERCLAGGE